MAMSMVSTNSTSEHPNIVGARRNDEPHHVIPANAGISAQPPQRLAPRSLRRLIWLVELVETFAARGFAKLNQR